MFNKQKFKIKLNYNHQFENKKKDLYKIYNSKLQHFDYFIKIAKNKDRSSNEFGKKIIYCKLLSIGKILRMSSASISNKREKTTPPKKFIFNFLGEK